MQLRIALTLLQLLQVAGTLPLKLLLAKTHCDISEREPQEAGREP